MADTPFNFNPLRFAAWSIIAAITVALLILGKALLVPFAIAIFIWILLGAIKSTLDRITPAKLTLPNWLANILAILTIVLATYASIMVIASQSDALLAAVPVYQANFTAIVAAAAC